MLEPRPEVLDAYLFGSRARGEAAPHSDVDAAVWLDPARRPEAPFGWVAEVSAELGSALGTDLDRPDLDLVVLNRAPPLLYHRVLRDGIRVLARDLAATTTREGRALSRYCDDLPRLARIAAMTPGEPDDAIVRRHLLALDEAVQVLRRSRGVTVERLRGDPEKRWAIEHGLQVCVQNALDLATHLAAAAGLDVPDYATAVDRLAELGIVPRDFAQRFRAIAGFRNVLVHGYLEVDLELIVRVLAERLDDLVELARHVAAARDPGDT